jgi:hypothetical protein
MYVAASSEILELYAIGRVLIKTTQMFHPSMFSTLRRVVPVYCSQDACKHLQRICAARFLPTTAVHL